MSRSERTSTLVTHPLAGPGAGTAAFPGRITERRPGSRLLAMSLPLPGLLLVGMALNSEVLAMAAGVLAVAVALLVPAVGLLEVVLFAPLLGRPILPYPGLLALLIGAVILGSVFRLSIDRPTLRIPVALAVMLSFLLYIFVQQLPTMLDGDPDDQLHMNSMLLRLLTAIVAVVASGIVLQGRSPRPFLAAMVISGCVAAGVAIVVFLAPSMTPMLGSMVLNPDQVTRPSGFFWDPNYFGMVLATLIIVSIGLLVEARGTTERVLALAALVTLLAGLGVSQSRSAVLVLLAALVLMAFLRSRATGVVVAGIAVLVGATAYFLLINVRLVASGGAVTDIGLSRLASSDAGRLDQILQGPELFLTSPLFGIGFGNFVLQSGDASHNWYMTVLAEQGLVGVVLMGLLIVIAVTRLRTLTGARRSMGAGVLAVLLLGGLFLEPMIAVQWSVPAAIALVAVFVADWGTFSSFDTFPEPIRR